MVAVIYCYFVFLELCCRERTMKVGQLIFDHYIEEMTKALKVVKKDKVVLSLQNQFFRDIK